MSASPKTAIAFFELSPVERAFFRKHPFQRGQVRLFPEEVGEMDPQSFRTLRTLTIISGQPQNLVSGLEDPAGVRHRMPVHRMPVASPLRHRPESGA